MSALRKYWWIALTSARSAFTYRGDMVSSALVMFVFLYVFLCLWQLTYSHSPGRLIASFTLPQMLWYLAMSESLGPFTSPQLSSEMDEEIRTGFVALLLTKPFSYPLCWYAKCLGRRVVRLAITAPLALITSFLLVGPIAFQPTGLLIFLLSLPLAITLDFLCQFLIGLSGFWLEDTSGIYRIYTIMCLIIGGTVVPITIFPEQWQPIVKALPFSNMIGGPARLFVDPSLPAFITLLARQGSPALVLILLTSYVYSVALKNINANGG